MGIDRIGKGGGVPPNVGDVGGPTKAGGTGRAFEVSKPEQATETQATQAVAPASTALEQLRAGKIDVHGYVDLKVGEATAHLHALPPEQLDSIRGMLREQISSDPALADLFRQATGHAPPVPEE
jgi:hypothetical protein